MARKVDLNSMAVRRERISVIQSLTAGTVPTSGLQALQVGRAKELESILNDVSRAADGVSAVRFVAGPPESGKTFLLNLAQSVAVERGLIAVRAEACIERRLHASEGEARALFRELMTNMLSSDSTETFTIGRLLQCWIRHLEEDSLRDGGSSEEIRKKIAKEVSPLHDLTHGFDFATVLLRYYDGRVAQDDAVQENALRWLRAEYTSKSEANEDLGVRTILDDDSFRDALNLFAAFAKIAGYKGLVVIVDELGRLTRRLTEREDRNGNHEAIVELLDDCLKGRIESTLLLFGVEDSCVSDRQRGLYSNERLARWLSPNRFALNGHRDFASPVIMLDAMKISDFPALLRNVRDVFGNEENTTALISDEDADAYVARCEEQLGAAYFDAPRTVIRDFIGLLHVLRENPNVEWLELLDSALASAKAEAEAIGLSTGGVDLSSAWHDEYEHIHRRTKHGSGGVLAAILVPLLILVVVVIGWMQFFPGTETKPHSDLEVKFSEVRSGLRLPLDETTVPLYVGNFYSIAAELAEPQYVYVISVDESGRAEYVFGAEPQLEPTSKIQIPGANNMLPLRGVHGTRTVIMFASPTPVDDVRRLRLRVEQLTPQPHASRTEMLVLREGQVEILSNEKIPADPNLPPSDAGFLSKLGEVFGEEFGLIQAIAFPLEPNRPHKGRTLYDFNG